VVHAWRMLGAPVLALSACAAVVYGLALAEPGVRVTQATAAAAAESISMPAIPWWLALLLAALFFEVAVVSIYTGAACLVLLLTVLGRGAGSLAPSLGAIQIVLWQTFTAITIAAAAAGSPQGTDAAYPELAVAGVALVLCTSVVWLAHWLPSLRTAAAHAPLVLIALDFGLAGLVALPGTISTAGGPGVLPSAWVYLAFIASVLPAPSCAIFGKALEHGAAAAGAIFDGLSDVCIYLLLQCLLICVFALLARSAVRRYRGGQP
jgi:hypothetical protein